MRGESSGHRTLAAHGLRISLAAALATPGSAVIAADARPPGAGSCSACHAALDASAPGTPPPLASLSPDEIAAALAAYRSGERTGTIMPRLAAGFSDAEARAIAAAVGRGGQASR